MIHFDDWFQKLTKHSPHPWQSQLASMDDCRSTLLRVPTGLGKTMGVVGAWAYHRVARNDDRWPRRLVFCLPMRVLVEQTESELRAALGRVGALWEGGAREGKVAVHVLMGGSASEDWHLEPDSPAVLVGTQDMLLSRALNRGYGSPRARWPMEFGLLGHDALWVLDEVQLMGVGLATTAAMEAFRVMDAPKALRPVYSWWMSATLRDDWLARSVDFAPRLSELARIEIPSGERAGSLWAAKKPLEIVSIPEASDPKRTSMAARVVEAHLASDRGVTLAVRRDEVTEIPGVMNAGPVEARPARSPRRSRRGDPRRDERRPR